MKEIRAGLLGFGTIGTGVVKVIQKNSQLLTERLGAKIVLTRVADLDITTDRGVSLPDGVLTSDAQQVVANPDIDVVIELIGGYEPARTFVLQAIENGKHIVTANKALLAVHGEEIFAAAEKAGVDIYDKDGFSQADHDILEFWMQHKDFYAEEINQIRTLSEASGIDYHKDFFTDAYSQMPAGIKGESSMAEGYMKVFAGGKGMIGSGLKDLLNLGYEPKWDMRVDNTITVHDAYGQKDFDLLLTRDRVGVDGPMKWNWGTKGGFFTKIHPVFELNPDNIAAAQEKIASEFSNYAKLGEPTGRVDEAAATAAAAEKPIIDVGEAKEAADKGVIDVGDTRHP